MLRDIASGMVFLHSRKPPIVHGDLRSPNLVGPQDCRLAGKHLLVHLQQFIVAHASSAHSCHCLAPDTALPAGSSNQAVSGWCVQQAYTL